MSLLDLNSIDYDYNIKENKFKELGKVFPPDIIGAEIINNQYYFMLLNLNSDEKGLFFNRYVEDDLNIEVKFILDNIEEYKHLSLFCQFRIYKMNIEMDLSSYILRDNLTNELEFFVFPLKKSNSVYSNIFNKENVNLVFKCAGEYICYFNIVVPSTKQSDNLVPRYKRCLNRHLKNICSPFFIVNVKNQIKIKIN